MDTDSGRFRDMPEGWEPSEDESNLVGWEWGERVQIKGGWFEVCKIDTRKQRLVLKPIPKPANEEAARQKLSDLVPKSRSDE
jgi:hypothetical protein